MQIGELAKKSGVSGTVFVSMKNTGSSGRCEVQMATANTRKKQRSSSAISALPKDWDSHWLKLPRNCRPMKMVNSTQQRLTEILREKLVAIDARIVEMKMLRSRLAEMIDNVCPIAMADRRN